MKYTIARTDLRLLQPDGFGPFDLASTSFLKSFMENREARYSLESPMFEALLEYFLNPSSAKRGTVQRLSPVCPVDRLTPKYYFLGAPYLLFARADTVRPSAQLALSQDVVSAFEVSGAGLYLAFDLKTLERSLMDIIDFPRSSFRIVKGVSISNAVGATNVSDVVNPVDYATLVGCRARPLPLDVIIPTTLVTKEPWSSEFMVFDRQLFVSESVDLLDSGLTATNNHCLVVAA